MNRISWMFMAVIEIVLYLLLAKAIYGENVKIEKTKAIYFALLVAVFFAIESFFKIPLAYTLMIIGVVVFSEGSVSRRFLNCLSVLIIAMGIQEFVTLFATNYSLTIFDTIIKMGDVYYICLMIIVTWVIKYLRERVKIDLKDIPNYIYINTILGFCAGILPLYLVKSLNNFIPKKVQSLIIVIGGLAIALNLFSIYLFVRNYQEKNKYGQESKEKSELMKVQAQYLENTVKNYEYLKAFRHDMKGHLRTLESMCEDNPQALNYIEKMGERINGTDVFECSNPMVSAVLNTFGNELNDEGIHLTIQYLVGGKLVMDDLDICSLLYNLTNNALEAERKVNKDYRKIEVQIKSVKNHLFIYVYNDVSDDFDMENVNKKQTTKEDKVHHGIGLQNIDSIVKKYLGQATYSLDDNGRFEAEIILQDVVKYYY